MKVFIRYLLIISVGVTLFAVTIFNIERNSIYIGGTHYHGTPPETAGYVSADRMADDPKNDKPVVVSASVHEEISPVVVSASVHEAKTPVVVSASAHEEKSPVVLSASVHEAKSPFIHSTDKTPAPSIDIMIDTITKLVEIITQKYTSPASKDIMPENTLSHDTIITSSKDNQLQKSTVSTDSPHAPLSFKGYLKTRDDTNTFTFTLDSACEVNISFTPSDGDKAYYVLSVYASSGTLLTRKIIDSEKSHSDSGRLYLSSGKYTLKIQRGYSWSGKPYTLNVNTSHSADTESEPNNSPHTANAIPVNQDIPASTGSRNDTDYFAFTLDKPSSVTPSLKFTPVRFSRGIYRFKLYELEILDTGKKPFIFRGDGTPSRKIKPFILEAGTYIISISRTESEELELGLHEYTLRVEAQEF